MNKKLVTIIVSVVVVMSIVFVAVLGSEAFGGYSKEKVTDIFFVKDSGDYYKHNDVINIEKNKETYKVTWTITPLNAEDKRINVVSSNNEIATAVIKGDSIIVTFLNPTNPETVYITIKSVDMGKTKTLCFLYDDNYGEI